MRLILSKLPTWLVLFVRLTRPLFLLGGFLMYALGVGIADYLGEVIDWRAYWLGQGCVTFLQLSAHYLNEYFDILADRDNPNRTPFSGGSGVTQLPRGTAMAAAATTLTGAAVLTVLLYRFGYLSGGVALVIGLSFIGSVFYSVPPVRLASSGYGELTTSILVANLVPALGFMLQYGSVHRLLAMSTFPLTALHLAMLLAFSLPDYGTDAIHEKRTLMVRMGWQRGMVLHNILVLAAYALVLLATFQGLPWSLAWPSLLTLPLGLFQVWSMNQIASGAPPRWFLLTFVALALFALTAYFITLSYWTG